MLDALGAQRFQARDFRFDVVGLDVQMHARVVRHLLHFDVQPNAVERSCLPLESIDEFDRRTMTIVSHNLAWPALTLPDPPTDVPA